MKKLVAIIAGDPESINSEIIAKTWFKKEKIQKFKYFCNWKIII